MTYINPNETAHIELRRRFEARFADARAKLRDEIDHLWRSETQHVILPAPSMDDKAAYHMFTFCELELPVCPPPAQFDYGFGYDYEGA